jgi:protoporphyrinogen oxidase
MTDPLPSSVGILIIGAGPTGLGAATRLSQRGHTDWCLIEASDSAGGLASSQWTSEGFIFDMGGHVIFSHFDYFDTLLDLAVSNWNTHTRISYIWFKNRYVPYPFQNNLFCLDTNDKMLCIDGLIDTVLTKDSSTPKTFDEWIVQSLGSGIADLFMRPYNFKVWAYPTTSLQYEWLGERVATVDIKRVIRNVLLNQQDEGWGPNAVFRFPKYGGTGEIWKKVAAKLPNTRMHFNRVVTYIDFENKVVSLSDGSSVKYESLVSTIPLDISLGWLGRNDLASRLRYSSTHVIGIGIRGISPHDKKCWLYYSEDTIPFYRATIFSLYAESNCPTADVCLPTIRRPYKSISPEDAVPRPGPYWSLMFEVSESRDFKPVDSDSVVEETIQGAVCAKLIEVETEIVSIFYQRLERGYPTPHLDRDSVLAEALPLLKSKRVWSRGRFGAWKYEVGNQDHSLMQGVEAVDNILNRSEETTLEFPNKVNGKRN